MQTKQEEMFGKSEFCDTCQPGKEPCAKCRKAIHQAWHKAGWWWVRQEECDETCPGKARPAVQP